MCWSAGFRTATFLPRKAASRLATLSADCWLFIRLYASLEVGADGRTRLAGRARAGRYVEWCQHSHRNQTPKTNRPVANQNSGRRMESQPIRLSASRNQVPTDTAPTPTAPSIIVLTPAPPRGEPDIRGCVVVAGAAVTPECGGPHRRWESHPAPSTGDISASRGPQLRRGPSSPMRSESSRAQSRSRFCSRALHSSRVQPVEHATLVCPVTRLTGDISRSAARIGPSYRQWPLT